ncbi:hypothetical protein [Paraburkholderia sp. J12]|uniref:hypothetical protein n=1 Tax=Paraburkholderia sp. J12 TaxID=2805432 RepID=UPI002ABD671A|nr:hypothetical protein [Paraburkholderia sp. J12]
MKKTTAMGTAALFLSACCSNSGTQIWHGQLGDTPYIATTADLRLALARPRQPALASAASGADAPAPASSAFDPNYTICTEPSPDVAKAISNALTANSTLSAEGLKALGASGASASLSETLAKTQNASLTELGRRLATTQMLRDGLFNLCEAYSNGAIQAIEYSLVLSRYGDTMVTLLAIEALSGIADNQVSATASSNVAASTAGASDAGQPGSKKNQPPDKGASAASAASAAEAALAGGTKTNAADPESNNSSPFANFARFLRRTGLMAGENPEMIRTAAAPPAASAAASASTVVSGSAASKKQHTRKNASKPATASAASAPSTTDTKPPADDKAAIANAIVQLQKAYLAQTQDAPIVILCAQALAAASGAVQDNSLAGYCGQYIKAKLTPASAASDAKANQTHN